MKKRLLKNQSDEPSTGHTNDNQFNENEQPNDNTQINQSNQHQHKQSNGQPMVTQQLHVYEQPINTQFNQFYELPHQQLNEQQFKQSNGQPMVTQPMANQRMVSQHQYEQPANTEQHADQYNVEQHNEHTETIELLKSVLNDLQFEIDKFERQSIECQSNVFTDF